MTPKSRSRRPWWWSAVAAGTAVGVLFSAGPSWIPGVLTASFAVAIFTFAWRGQIVDCPCGDHDRWPGRIPLDVDEDLCAGDGWVVLTTYPDGERAVIAPPDAPAVLSWRDAQALAHDVNIHPRLHGVSELVPVRQASFTTSYAGHIDMRQRTDPNTGEQSA